LTDAEAGGNLASAGSGVARQVFEDLCIRDARPENRFAAPGLGLAPCHGSGAQQPGALVNQRSKSRDLALDLLDSGLNLSDH